MATKKLILVIVIFVVLAAYYILGTGYLKGKNQNTALAADIADSTQLLMEIPAPPADLKERLEAIQNELELTMNLLPDEPNTTQIINYILQLGESSGVKVVPVITQSWEIETYDGYNVAVFSFSLSVRGTASQFLQFFTGLEKAEFETMVIQTLHVYRDDDSQYLKSISSGPVEVTADIQLAVFGRALNDIQSETQP